MAALELLTILVEVWVSVAPRHAQGVPLQLAAGASAGEALQASGLLGSSAELNASSVQDGLKDGRWALAVGGRKVPWSHPLRAGDRLELLRALTVDPKEARRLRYRAQGEKLPKGFRRSPKTPKPTPST